MRNNDLVISYSLQTGYGDLDIILKIYGKVLHCIMGVVSGQF